MVAELLRRWQPALPFGAFTRAAWVGGGAPVVGGDEPLAWNWHLDALCDHLESLIVDDEAPQNLLINVPPGTMKSLIVSVFLPAWVWLWRPTWRSIFASGSPSVVTRDSLKCRTLVTCEWYRDTFRPTWGMSPVQDEKQLFANTAGGSRQGLGAGAAVTGAKADFLGVDDPNDAKEIHSKQHRENINERWWSTAFRNRVAHPTKSKRAIIMQRLHAADLSGYVLDREKGQWAHLKIPMEFSGPKEAPKKTWLGWSDPRTLENELLFSKRFGPDFVAEEKVALGSTAYAGQHQQEPSADKGNKFSREWWRFFALPGQIGARRPLGSSTAPALLINFLERDFRWDELIISMDAAFKDLLTSDYVVAGVIGRLGANKFVLRRVRAHLNIVGTIALLVKLKEDFPRVGRIYVEDKANGSAVIAALKDRLPGIIPIEPRGGKEARAAAIEPQVEAGNVYLPEGAEWLDEWIDEFADFPLGKHDDQVDMLSQALNEMGAGKTATDKARALLGL